MSVFVRRDGFTVGEAVVVANVDGLIAMSNGKTAADALYERALAAYERGFYAMSFQEWREMGARMDPDVPAPTFAQWRDAGRRQWEYIKSQPGYVPVEVEVE